MPLPPRKSSLPASSRGGNFPPRHAWLRSVGNQQIQVVFPERAEDDEVRAFCDELGLALGRMRGPLTLHIDARQVRVASGAQRQMLIDFRKTHEAVVREKVAAAAFIIDSALVRGLFAAIMFLRPPPYPHRVFSDAASGQAWLESAARRPPPI